MTRQRWLLKERLKLGFSLSVSDRALIILDPILGSLAQKGIKPHLIFSREFPPSR
jgi:hypothetical protein